MQAAKDLYAMAGVARKEYVYGEEELVAAPESCQADSKEIVFIFDSIYDALCDDMNTPMVLAAFSESVKLINSAKAGQLRLSQNDLKALVQLYDDVLFGVLGLVDEELAQGASSKVVAGLMDMVLEQRAKAKAAKDWSLSDHIRDSLSALGIKVKDTKDGAEWSLE